MLCRGSSENIMQFNVFIHKQFALIGGSGQTGVSLVVRVGSKKIEIPAPLSEEVTWKMGSRCFYKAIFIWGLLCARRGRAVLLQARYRGRTERPLRHLPGVPLPQKPSQALGFWVRCPKVAAQGASLCHCELSPWPEWLHRRQRPRTA